MVVVTGYPFKKYDNDPEYGTATVLRCETLLDHLRVRLGRYKRCGGPMHYTLSPGLWQFWYDPESVRATASASSPSTR